MITGFNTNVRHGGRVFHVQTEDSGRNHPHVISHLYFGGTILSSEKRDYADHLEADDLTGVVRGLMEEQHRSMLERLRAGHYDPVIAERLDGASTQSKTAPAHAPPAADTQPGFQSDGRATPVPPPSPEASAAGSAADTDEKPLDEMILDFLVDKARGRGSRPRE